MGDPGPAQPDRLTKNLDSTLVGLDQTGKEFDDSRFASTVFAEQRVDRPGLDGERDFVHGDGGAEGLAQAGHSYRHGAGRFRHSLTLPASATAPGSRPRGGPSRRRRSWYRPAHRVLVSLVFGLAD